MKHIAFIIASLNQGGAERVVTTLANTLAERGYQVSLVLMIDGQRYYSVSEKVSIESLDSQKDQGLPIWKRWPLRLKKLRRVLKKLQPDVAVSFMAETNIDVCMASVGLRVPVIVSERNDPKLDPPGRFKQWLRRVVYHRANGFVFQTPDARDYFAPWIRRRGTIILNPLTGKIPQIYEGPRDNRIVAMGRLNAQKNYPLMLRSFRDFSQSYPEYRLEIYGGGDQEAAIREQIRSLGLDEKVRLMGFCADVHNAIREAAFFVMSSDFEGMPNALIEAMALGLPCICTDCPCGGPGMLVENGVNGLLTPVGDREALMNAMITMAENPQGAAQMGREAANIRHRVDLEGIADQWVCYLEKILQREGRKQ